MRETHPYMTVTTINDVLVSANGQQYVRMPAKAVNGMMTFIGPDNRAVEVPIT